MPEVYRYTVSWSEVVERRVNRVMRAFGVDRSAALKMLVMSANVEALLANTDETDSDDTDDPSLAVAA